MSSKNYAFHPYARPSHCGSSLRVNQGSRSRSTTITPFDDDNGIPPVVGSTLTTSGALSSLFLNDRMMTQSPFAFPKNNITPFVASEEDKEDKFLAEAPVSSPVIISPPVAPNSSIIPSIEEHNIAEASEEPLHHNSNNINIAPVDPRLPPAVNSSPTAAAAAATGTNASNKTLRFRGVVLNALGSLYPSARFHVHRVGHPAESDFEADGRDLSTALHPAHNLRETIFRVTMKSPPGVPQPDEAEPLLVWSRAHAVAAAADADAAVDDDDEREDEDIPMGEDEDVPSGEECRNVITLGGPSIGKLMLFTYFARGNRSWGLARQVPGREYTLEQCCDVLCVPQVLREQIEGFGPRLWQVGNNVPRLWICKDLETGTVVGKIRNIMRN